MKFRRSQRGATLVEAAVTVVALFTLIMGAVDFGRAYNVYQNVTNAAREGARFAVAPDPNTGTLPSTTDVQAHITAFMASINVQGTPTISTTTRPINNIDVTFTSVVVVSPYHFFFFPFADINITASSEMRNETN
jgi:Flp pilus assembly protein TadG